MHGFKAYVVTFVALLVLTSLTLGLSSVRIASAWAIAIAVAIATVKSILILLYFMHLREQHAVNWIGFVASVLLAATLVGLTTLDVASRWLPAPLGPEPTVEVPPGVE